MTSLTKLYNLYKYNSPIYVMTSSEVYVFNAVMLGLVALSAYWMIAVLPKWLLFFAERCYFYCTGNTISASVLISLCVLGGILAPEMLQNSNTTHRKR